MSDMSQGHGWWQASDGKWYSPGMHPDYRPGPGPEPKQKKSRTGLIVAGSIFGVIVLIVVIAAIAAPRKEASTSAAVTTPPVTTPSPPTTAAPPVTTAPPPTTVPSGPRINRVAKDGDFAFTVTGMQCGVTSLGSDGFSEQAPAGTQWCLVTMTVANDKTSSQTFFASNQKATDSQGRQLDADTGALIYLPNNSSAVFAQINPGVSITAVVPFQISTTDSIVSFELHDSAFSGGVTVSAT